MCICGHICVWSGLILPGLFRCAPQRYAKSHTHTRLLLDVYIPHVDTRTVRRQKKTVHAYTSYTRTRPRPLNTQFTRVACSLWNSNVGNHRTAAIVRRRLARRRGVAAILSQPVGTTASHSKVCTHIHNCAGGVCLLGDKTNSLKFKSPHERNEII